MVNTRERPRPGSAAIPGRKLVVTAAVRPVSVPVPVPPPAAPAVAPGPARPPAPGRILCWQAAALLVTLAPHESLPPAGIAVVSATALVVSTIIRHGDLRLYQVAASRCRFVLRARRRRLPDNRDRARVLLDLLVPGSTVRGTDTGQGPVATFSHPGGLTALLRPLAVGAAPISSFPTPAALLSGLPDDFGMQVVFHSGARPESGIRMWLALHVGRGVERPSDEELIPLLHHELRRVRHTLDKACVPTEAVPEDAALVAISALAHVGRGRHEIREGRRFWRTGSVSQACFSLRGGDESDLQRLADGLLSHTPDVAVTMVLSQRGRSTGALLRFAATSEAAVDAAAEEATRLFSATDIHLTRLDGAHRRGVAASLPIGGFLC